MKLNIECTNLDFNPQFTLEENGLISLLATYNNTGVVELEQISGPNDIKHVAYVLKSLNQKGLFHIKETNENDSLVLNVINGQQYSSAPITNISVDKKIQICFQLNPAKIKSIKERSTDANSFKFNLVAVCFENYTERKLPISEINNQDDFNRLMYSITPFEMILSHGKRLTRKDFDQVFDLIKYNQVELGMINFAIDYSINNSTYHNLNYQFVQVLLDNWKKHQITTVDGAIEHIKQLKAVAAAKSSRYTAPEYEQPEVQSTAVGDENKLKNLFVGDDQFE